MPSLLHSARQNTPPAPPRAVFTSDHPPLAALAVTFIIVDVVMWTLAVSWTAMRIWVRRFRKMSPLLMEDILCYLALLCFTASVIGHFISIITAGLGQHRRRLNPTHLARYGKLVFFAQVIYGPTIGLVKLSIIRMLQRIFVTPRFRIASSIVMASCAAWILHPILVALLVCRPIAYNWDQRVPGGRCGNRTLAYVTVSAVDLFTDLLILILPLRMVAKLQIELTHKLALAVIFGFGTITMVFTAVRAYYIYNVDVTDMTFSGVPSSIVASVQMGVAICVSSSPLLRPLFDRTVGKWVGLSLRSLGRTAKARSRSYGKAVASAGSGKLDKSSSQDHELVTFGRLGRNSGFRKMGDGGGDGDSNENLQTRLAAIGRENINVEATVQSSARVSHDSKESAGRGGITVVRSATVSMNPDTRRGAN